MRSAPAIAPWTVCHSSPRAVIGWKKRCSRRRKAVSVPSEIPAPNAGWVPIASRAPTEMADRIAVMGV
jgi:hypothetical protein